MARRTKQQWQVLVEQHAQSVLTTRDFCQQHNIHLQTFYSRRHALGLATPTKRSKKMPITAPTSQFVQAKLVNHNSSIVMQTREAQLSFSSVCDQLWVAKLLKVLAAA
ncbi:hypothetical protein [uncultured Paraglaciecola sp.]|uniref:IS66 family insertion sequence element accessory protein TnpA n=1 Tax=uncultured Paraglaciecola sp. TaxID=1765024 RepID=UPI0025CFDE6E|nr:hypothetical protein [uncultured Paraglaciecola sp.]